jgi:hypothetical protein
VTDILKELEDSWGVQRDLWSSDQWKNAAILSAKSYDQSSKAHDDLIQATDEARFHAQEHINLLEERLEKSEADNTKLIGWIKNKLIKNSVGRPKKPKPPITSFGALLALANSVKPKPKRGKTPKYSQQDKVILIAIADRTKRDHEKITTDIDAMRHFCRDVPARRRQTAIEKFAKLLSRFRKEIANKNNNDEN